MPPVGFPSPWRLEVAARHALDRDGLRAAGRGGPAGPRARHRAPPEPRRVQQHRARPARRRPPPRGRLPAGRLGLRLRQQRRRALAVAGAHGELRRRRRARGARRALRARRATAGPDQARRRGRAHRAVARVPAEYDDTGLTLRNAVHASTGRRWRASTVVRAILGGERPAGSEPVEVGFYVDDARPRACSRSTRRASAPSASTARTSPARRASCA